MPRGALVAFLESWLHLLSEPLDLQIAKHIHLINVDTSWKQWIRQVEAIVTLVEDFRQSHPHSIEYPITQRRLSWRYRLAYRCHIPFDGYKDLIEGVQGEWSFQCHLESSYFRDRYQRDRDSWTQSGDSATMLTKVAIQNALSAYREGKSNSQGPNQAVDPRRSGAFSPPRKEAKKITSPSAESFPTYPKASSRLYQVILHATCPSCKHYTNGRFIDLPQDQSRHARFACDRCGRHMMGFGRTSTQTSLASIDSIPIDTAGRKSSPPNDRPPLVESLPRDSLDLLRENSPSDDRPSIGPIEGTNNDLKCEKILEEDRRHDDWETKVLKR